MTFLKQYPPPWSWDDEEKPVAPYVQVYCDEGTVAVLHYFSPIGQADCRAFAGFVCDLVNRQAETELVRVLSE